MNSNARIIEPDQMETPAGKIRYLFLPGRDLFTRRAARLRFLSIGHPLSDYLAFLALLADAQQNALNQIPTQSLPDPNEQTRSRVHGMPLLDANSWSREPAWQSGLQVILRQLREAALPLAARETLVSLKQANEAGLETMADRILAGNLADISPQVLPFVAAALQVYWVHMATSLGEDAFRQLNHGGFCPVCGTSPMVGIVRNRGVEQGLRYLSCSLCASEWHMVRIKCSNCESTEGINFYTLEGSNSAVKAECCDNCSVYLKLLYLERDSQMESSADDLASLALDMLMDKEGKVRKGPNLLFHPGTYD